MLRIRRAALRGVTYVLGRAAMADGQHGPVSAATGSICRYRR